MKFRKTRMLTLSKEVTLLLQLSSWLLQLWPLTFIPFDSRLYVKYSVLKLLTVNWWNFFVGDKVHFNEKNYSDLDLYLTFYLFIKNQGRFSPWKTFNRPELLLAISLFDNFLGPIEGSSFEPAGISLPSCWGNSSANSVLEMPQMHESKNENENHINFDQSTHSVNCSVVRLIELGCSRLFPLILVPVKTRSAIVRYYLILRMANSESCDCYAWLTFLLFNYSHKRNGNHENHE